MKQDLLRFQQVTWMTIVGQTSASKPLTCLRRLEGNAKFRLRPVAISMAILQHFDPGFCTAVGRKLQETYRTAPKTTRFSQNLSVQEEFRICNE